LTVLSALDAGIRSEIAFLRPCQSEFAGDLEAHLVHQTRQFQIVR